jgi:hypothetical protein
MSEIWPKTDNGLYVKYPLFLSDFNGLYVKYPLFLSDFNGLYVNTRYSCQISMFFM